MEQRRHFDLDAQVAEWRRWQERTSSLSPRELDELEDHLRAHVDLEMALNPGLGLPRAFGVACREIGTGAVLSKEFAKVGKARWRRVFLVGWAMYAASFSLPTPDLPFDYGYHVLGFALSGLLYPQVLGFLVLPNLTMLMAIPVLLGRKPPFGRCLKWMLGFAGVGAMGATVIVGLATRTPQDPSWWNGIVGFGPGFWTWATSLTVVATALHMRAREWASARPQTSARMPRQGAFR